MSKRKTGTQRPEKPEKNGHYSGLYTGFEYQDGEYGLAPVYRNEMASIVEEERNIQAWMDGQNAFAVRVVSKVTKRKTDWWKRLAEDIGLDIANEGFEYNNGFVKSTGKREQEYSCIYCGLKGFKGRESIIAHHGECKENSLVKKNGG